MSRPYCRNSLLAIAAVVLLIDTAYAARSGKTTGEPIVITSDRMEAEKLGDKVTFLGNVTLKKEGMTLSSDSMVVFYDAITKDIREIEAYGNVVVHKDSRVALSNIASYFSREEKIILTGDARIIENENQIGGEKITLFMRDDRSIVEGGKVLLYQEKKTDKATEEKRQR
jgi:lipopolysaccharide export system protein LptA